MRNASRSLIVTACALFAIPGSQTSAVWQRGADPKTPVVDDYKITILSDSIPGRKTIGEWGFSALVEVTSGGVTKRFLFDTSDKPGTVLGNASALGLEICDIEDVVLSHHHADHTGGLVNLRQTCASSNPKGISRVHVGAPEIFWSRVDSAGNEKNPLLSSKVKSSYEALGGTFIVNDQPHEFLLPGLFLTGKIARTHDEKTYVPVTPMQIKDPSGQLGVELVPEDQAIVINSAAGAVVLTGCAHAGAVNTVEQAIRIVGGWPNIILAGGLHWFQMDQGDWHTEGTLDWEARFMARLGVVAMLGGHCTGFERFVYMRDYLRLDPKNAAMSAVGTILGTNPLFTFTLPQAVNTPVELTHECGH